MHNPTLSDQPAELSDNKRALSAIAGSLLIYFVTKNIKGIPSCYLQVDIFCIAPSRVIAPSRRP